MAIVKVYSDFVCDFSFPTPVIKGQPVTFTSTSNHYGGSSIGEYAWNFGDEENPNSYNTTGQQVEHTYQILGKYWVKHRVKAGDKYAYMIRRVNVQGPPDPPKVWVRLEPPFVPPPGGGLMSYLDPGRGGAGDYIAYLSWRFILEGSLYSEDDFLSYTAERIAPQQYTIPPSWSPGYKKLVRNVEDPERVFKGNTYTWRVTAHLDANDSCPPLDLRGYCTKKVGEQPPPSGGCPEAIGYYKEDTLQGSPIHVFLSNNTILPHSEHAKYAGQVRMDLLKLEVLEAYADHYFMYILENDDETSYIDELRLWVVDHPEGTEVAVSSDSSIYIYSDVALPLSCWDNNGKSRYEEIAYQDDTTYVGNDSSYLTVTFPYNDWSSQGLLIGTGIYAIEGAEEAPMPKNYLSIPNKPDGEGGWIPAGEAFARKKPSLWLFDVSDVDINTFRIDCEGDSCYIDYVGLVKLEDSGWTDTTVSPTMALRWYQVGGVGGEWKSSDVTAKLLSIGDSACVLSPSEQLAVMFPAVPANPDTSMVRDYVLESYGFYTPLLGSPADVEETEPVFTYAFNVKQIRPFSRTATISYQVPRSTHVSLALYDVSGRLVKSFVDEEITRGKYSISWDGTDSKGAKVSSGAYFIRIKAGSFLKTQKLVILE